MFSCDFQTKKEIENMMKSISDFKCDIRQRYRDLQNEYDKEISKLKSEVMLLRAYNELFKNENEDIKEQIKWDSNSINNNKALVANEMSKNKSISLKALLTKVHDIIKDECVKKGTKYVYIYFGRKVTNCYSIEELSWDSNTTKLNYIIAILKDEGFNVEWCYYDKALKIIWDKEGEDE